VTVIFAVFPSTLRKMVEWCFKSLAVYHPQLLYCLTHDKKKAISEASTNTEYCSHMSAIKEFRDQCVNHK
jgi:hypothetical protein